MASESTSSVSCGVTGVVRILGLLYRGTVQQAQDDYNDSGATPYTLRSPDEIAGFFDGLELVEPDVVPCPQWHPDDAVDTPADIDAFGGVGRKR